MPEKEPSDKYRDCARRSLEFLIKSLFEEEKIEEITEKAHDILYDNYNDFTKEGVSSRISMCRAYEVAINYVQTESYAIQKKKNLALNGDLGDGWFDKEKY